MEPPQIRGSFTCWVESDSHWTCLGHDWVWVDSNSADFLIHRAGCSMVADTWTDSMQFSKDGCRFILKGNEIGTTSFWTLITWSVWFTRKQPESLHRFSICKWTLFLYKSLQLCNSFWGDFLLCFKSQLPCPYLAHMTIKFLHNWDNRPPMCCPSGTLIFSKMRLKRLWKRGWILALFV